MPIAFAAGAIGGDNQSGTTLTVTGYSQRYTAIWSKSPQRRHRKLFKRWVRDIFSSDVRRDLRVAISERDFEREVMP